MLNIGETIVI